MEWDALWDGLNEEQRRAVEAVRGPVCVLAGAGSGKTTTITRRIAAQVTTRAFEPGEILAVTFTDKAAGEMRTRLGGLGVAGVRARTFHSAAAAQLRYLAAEAPGDILPTKAIALSQIARTLPKPYRFRPAADLATEIEWAKNQRLAVDAYERDLGRHEPPIPSDLMVSVWRRYEDGKLRRGLIDFEDLLESTIRMFDEDQYALERFHARYRAFTVDEYQDVNLLQQSLLERWLGERDDLCVVGDDLQSIYSFTGATPEYLINMPQRFPRTTTIHLTHNYRSTPEVLDVANRLASTFGGTPKKLLAARGAGARPILRPFASSEEETKAVVQHIRELADEGVAHRDMAILYRANFRSEDYEAALADARIPFQVRDGGFLQRQAARRLLAPLRRSAETEVADTVRSAATRAGWTETIADGVGDREVTRQKDLTRLVRLAEELDDGERTLRGFVAEVEARFGSDGAGAGVNLLTYHRAKGLEFEAVFLPRLQEGELPFKRSVTEDSVAEERRLFYVGITRARRYLFISWLSGGRQKPSRFLATLTPSEVARRHGAGVTAGERSGGQADPDVVAALKSWRLRRAQSDGVPAYVVMHDRTLDEIARARPAGVVQLGAVRGMGPTRIERYGAEILEALGTGVSGRSKDPSTLTPQA
ncbi:MAG: ATP-dependent helicase [Actinomycetota bacterium]